MRFRLNRLLALTGLTLLLTATGSKACIVDQLDSIHFASGRPDFGTLPRRGVMYYEEDIRATSGGYGGTYGMLYDGSENIGQRLELSPDRDENREAARKRQEKALRARAQAAITAGQWKRASGIYATIPVGPQHRGDIRSRIEILGQATAQTPLSHLQRVTLQEYLHGLNLLLDTEKSHALEARAIFDKIAASSNSGFLRSYARYQSGSLFVIAAVTAKSARQQYAAALQEAPPPALREAILIMLARAAVLPEKAEDRDLSAGTDAIRRLLNDYPGTRFRTAAEGLQARIDYRQGNLGPAIETYFRLDDLPSVEIVLKSLPTKKREPFYPRLLAGYLHDLDHAQDYKTYSRAVADTRKTLAVLTPAGATDFVAKLRRDPGLVAPYFYYRLYHCTNEQKDTRNLAKLATRLTKANPDTRFPSLVQVRFAEVFYQAGQNREALQWAERALRGAGAAPFDRALFVHGAALQKLKRNREALADFETLLAKCPNSPLRYTAHEERALLREDTGDLSGALDDYFALHYKDDIAFFLDARMTIPQVASYIDSHPNHPRHDMLVYSLGIRHLRAEHWSEASRCLRSIPRSAYRVFWNPVKEGKTGWNWGFDTDSPAPLQVIAELSRLKRHVDQAQSRREKAAALFAYGNYYYKNGTLLLYNGAAWEGGRADAFAFDWNESHATREDAAAARAHMYAHETYARAEKICLEIADKYPETPSAAPALYRAGCCENKLSHFNDWWRQDSREHDHIQASANLMARLVKHYPRHPMAQEARKFTRVWSEEATLTANQRAEE